MSRASEEAGISKRGELLLSRLSRYQEKLEEIISTDEYRVVPESRKNEVLSFIRSGLEDFSISRSVKRARGWGIPVPGDPSQIVYVWFDALANYITALGYAEDSERFREYWPAEVHVVGKGITRFHAIYWPAMLLSAGLPLPRTLFVHGYLTVEGQKISKSLGNAVDPAAVAGKYGSDALRYYLSAAFSPFEDGDFSVTHLEEIYNADLANGLGNLASRIGKLCERSGLEFESDEPMLSDILSPELRAAMENFEPNRYLRLVWARISSLNRQINSERPWEYLGNSKLKTQSSNLRKVLGHFVSEIREIAVLVEPFIPKAAAKIKKQFQGPRIRVGEPLFPRLV